MKLLLCQVLINYNELRLYHEENDRKRLASRTRQEGLVLSCQVTVTVKVVSYGLRTQPQEARVERIFVRERVV